MQQSRHHCVTLYFEKQCAQLALEAYFGIQHVDLLVGNRPSFECKFYGNLYFVLPHSEEFVPWLHGQWIAQNVSNDDRSWA